MFFLFMSSGLFLGWSLGANDAANVFGTAVGSKMIRFRTAAAWCGAFIILGAVISGAGASHTLGKLGSVNAVAGAFVVALAAAVSVYLMTKAEWPVSTSQAIVGAIIGWNFFSGSLTDYDSLTKIVTTWLLCPVLSALFSILFYKLTVLCIRLLKFHMFRLDALTRRGLLLAGIFGSYSLGANNIANVMGVFVPVSPFSDISFSGFTLNSAQQLFFIGAVAIAVGVFTYSKRVMTTVGEGLLELTPVAAFVVVWAHSIVLFIFSSQTLEAFLLRNGLPSIPLVPVSSSQAIVGAVIGIGLLKGGKGIRWRTLGGIACGWVVTPALAAVLSLVSLFFLQNVFQQKTYRPVTYLLSPAAMERIQSRGGDASRLAPLANREFPSAASFNNALSRLVRPTREERDRIMDAAKKNIMEIDAKNLARMDPAWLCSECRMAVKQLEGRRFLHRWQLDAALSGLSPHWRASPGDARQDERLRSRLKYLHNLFSITKYHTNYKFN